jgi:hypothetical protein
MLLVGALDEPDRAAGAGDRPLPFRRGIGLLDMARVYSLRLFNYY